MSVWSRWRTKRQERKQAQAEALKSLHDEPSLPTNERHGIRSTSGHSVKRPLLASSFWDMTDETGLDLAGAR